MNFFAWCRLKILEQKLYGEFGKYNRYRCWCLKRKAKTAKEKLLIAKEVWDGPGVNTMEAQGNELYLRKVEATRPQQIVQEVKGQPPQETAPKTHPQEKSVPSN